MKWLSIALVVWLPSLPVAAEAESSIAFKGGFNAATFNKKHRENRPGSSGGLAGALQRPLGGRFLLGGQIDLLYTPRGSEVFIEGELQGKARLHYLDVVVAARPEVRLGPASVYLLLGGGLDFLVSAYDENSQGARRYGTSGLHRVDVALLVGAGVALHLPRWGLGPVRIGTVFLEARHDRGLRDIDAFVGFRNRTSSLMLGLSFALGSGAGTTRPKTPPVPSDPPCPLPPPAS